MNKAEAVKKLILDPGFRFNFLAKYGFLNWMNDEQYLRKMFFYIFGYELNLDNPKTYNEKLQWLKLYDRKPIYSTMVDKYAAKKYVASIIGDEYIIPTIGVWDRVEDIDFNSLPNQFVIKCTHDSHGLVICKDKSSLDIESTKKKLSKALKHNYYLKYREWPYKNVKPRIIAEKYMEDSKTADLKDYKFFCFGGQAKCFKVDFDRFIEHRSNYFSADGEQLKIGEQLCPPDLSREIKVPENLMDMRELAENLSEAIPFLRVDFYDVDGKVYFGELTFYPASGFGKFVYEKNDELLGSWLKLPEENGGRYCLVINDLVCILNTTVSDKIIQIDKKHLNHDSALKDYKIYTFNGAAKICMINQDRGTHTRADYFDRQFNWLDFKWGYDHADFPIEKPKNYEKMFELAEILSAETIELRVDFYEINGRIYFGELTFFDGSGFDIIEPREWDLKLGSWVDLPKK